jgi:hypothetical protein
VSTVLQVLTFPGRRVHTLDDRERERHPKRHLHADRERATETSEQRGPDPAAAVEFHERLDHADDRHDDGE